MERIFFVKQGDFGEINEYLKKGCTVKAIHPIAQTVSSYGYASGGTYASGEGVKYGEVFAYIVLEYDENKLKRN